MDKFHPLSDLFPALKDKELKALAEDIKAHGLRQPIVTYKGQIIDGRNRYLACQMIDVEPVYEKFDDDNPVDLVISLNLARRHLTASQRAMIAAKLADMRRGDNQHAQNCATSQSEAAEKLKVSRRSVQQAKEVIDHGTPELVESVQAGEIPVSVGARKAKAKYRAPKPPRSDSGPVEEEQIQKTRECGLSKDDAKVSQEKAKEAQLRYEKLIQDFVTFVTTDHFILIRNCLHPDKHLNCATDKSKLAEAFAQFNELEMLVYKHMPIAQPHIYGFEKAIPNYCRV